MPTQAPGEQPDDEELVAAVRRGDAEAAAELFRRYQPDAIRFASVHAKGGLAEDVVSEAFERVFAALSQGGGPDSFRPYLFTTIRRISVDLHRKHAREVPGAVSETGSAAPPAALVSEDTAGASLDAGLVRKAFLSLPERWRLVLWYTAVESRTNQETAELIGGNANSVAVLGFRAREGLRNAYLAQHVGAERDRDHREVLEQLPRWIRGGLSPARTAAVEEHLESCASCSAVAAEVAAINTNLGAVIGPALLGLGLTAPALVVRTGLSLWRLVLLGFTASALFVAGLLLAGPGHRAAPTRHPPAVPPPSVVLAGPTLHPLPITSTTTAAAPVPEETPSGAGRPAVYPSPAPLSASPTPTRASPVDVGLGAWRSTTIGDSAWRHLQIDVRGEGAPLDLTVLLAGSGGHEVHQDSPYGAWQCTAPSPDAPRLACRLPAGAQRQEFAIDLQPTDREVRVSLVLAPVGLADPHPADNRSTIVLPVP